MPNVIVCVLKGYKTPIVSSSFIMRTLRYQSENKCTCILYIVKEHKCMLFFSFFVLKQQLFKQISFKRIWCN